MFLKTYKEYRMCAVLFVQVKEQKTDGDCR